MSSESNGFDFHAISSSFPSGFSRGKRVTPRDLAAKRSRLNLTSRGLLYGLLRCCLQNLILGESGFFHPQVGPKSSYPQVDIVDEDRCLLQHLNHVPSWWGEGFFCVFFLSVGPHEVVTHMVNISMSHRYGGEE